MEMEKTAGLIGELINTLNGSYDGQNNKIGRRLEELRERLDKDVNLIYGIIAKGAYYNPENIEREEEADSIIAQFIGLGT